MKILLLCPHFEPDLHAATGEVMTQLVTSLADRGHEISVVSALPWYKDHAVEPHWRGRLWRTEKTEWGQVVRVWPFPTDKTNIPARAVGFGGFTTLAATAALRLGRHDVVMGMSPPVFLGDAAWLVSKRWGVPFVFNTQDIFPDVAVDLGALQNRRVIDLARRHERSIYRRADAITVLSKDQAYNVSAKLPESSAEDVVADKVHIIQNFADLGKVSVVERENAYRSRHGLNGKVVVMYSGNVGLSQSFDLIRAAAQRWRDFPEVHFVINGEGAARPDVDGWAKPLPNVSVVDFAPRSEVSDVLGAADLHLILLKKGLSKSSTPSKLYGILAAGRPVLASIDVGSEVASVVERANCGRSVPPEQPDMFCEALDALLAQRQELESMGRRARDYVETCLTPAVQAEQYEQLFRQLTECSKQPAVG